MQMNEMFYGGGEPHWLKQSQYKRPHDYTADFDYPHSGVTLPTHEFRVPMCCPKCEEKVREELSELDGVYEIFVDQVHERVSVIGFVDAYQALKKMKRVKKKSQFWDDFGSSSHNSSSSSHRGKKTTHHSRDHETVYRASPSQVSHRRDRSSRLKEVSSVPNRRSKSYDDEAAYRPAATSAHRNKFFGSYDDEISFRPAKKFYGSYDDEISFRPAKKFHGSYDDEISFRPAKKFYGSYDDEISFRPPKKYYGAYDDNIAYRPSITRFSDEYSPPSNQFCFDSRPSSSLFCCSPRSRSLRYESVPPYAQEYYTEEPVEQYPFYAPY